VRRAAGFRAIDGGVPLIQRLLAVSAGALILVGSVAAQGVDALYERLEPSVWSVVAVDRRGESVVQASAVVIGPGRLITTCVPLRQAAAVRVRRDNVSYGATLEFPDVERNLCQLKVANFKAPAVEVADASALRVGMRVYAIGTPRGLESTLSDGLLSAMRRDEEGQLRMLQTSAPVSAGSGGGGLFDAQGRLVGIMAGIQQDAQNLNFAIPAYLIKEIAERGQRALDAWTGKAPLTSGGGATSPARPAAPSAPAASAAADTAVSLGRRPGDWFQYVITDSSTGTRRMVALQVDRIEGEGVLFNGGRRREDATGQATDGEGAILGELDLLTPPGGWPALQSGSSPRELTFENQVLGRLARFELMATVNAAAPLKVQAGEFESVRIDLKGWHTRAGSPSGQGRAPYVATVWWSPQLRRVVRFTVDSKTSQGMGSPGSFTAWESLELVKVDRR
jgi:S1-C subfamily serine protease